MKTEYKWLVFKEIETKGKTRAWDCINKGDELLGTVKWYSAFRKHSFFPKWEAYGDLIFSPGCLEDIAFFCKLATQLHKEGRLV